MPLCHVCVVLVKFALGFVKNSRANIWDVPLFARLIFLAIKSVSGPHSRAAMNAKTKGDTLTVGGKVMVPHYFD